jgi:hypothetical protein
MKGMMNTENKASGAQEDGTAVIEAKPSQIPSSAYLAAALASMATSAVFKASGKDHAALFVGQWAAPFLRSVSTIKWSSSTDQMPNPNKEHQRSERRRLPLRFTSSN